jgi:uncharacterized protein YneF (UPF0154 family)
MLPLAVSWALLALVVLGLFIYRRSLASHEDDYVHLQEGDAKLINEQALVAQRLEKVDYWGKLLTVIAFLYGLGLAGYFIYLTWMESSSRVVVG